MNRRSLLAALILSTTALSAMPSFAQDDLTSVQIRLDWRPGAQHAPFYYGQASGLYAQEGIDLEIISGSGSSDTVKQVGANAVEFGLVDGLVLVQAKAQDVPVVAIAGFYQDNPTVVISPQDSPITSPDQLTDGVLLGNKKGSATSQGLSAMLSANGISEDDVEMADVGFGVQPLLVGQVGAMMGFEMNEPIEAATLDMAVHVMPVSEFGVDAYGLTLVAGQNVIADNPDLVAGFVRATLAAMQASMDNPHEAIAAVAGAVDEVDTDREAKVLELTTPYWTGSADREIGAMSEARWQSTSELAAKLGLVDAAPEASSLFTTDFIAQ
ncbi:ABC transporter substrate-binding protein [Devosia sp. 1566]|uniref:ABC transporter substrate-binding protein n=1 Tax=Devosia sp. 1566 TaxID=2499144 RepID=UPI000FDAC03B|nr:ABC transporter substrate-binding protein [Devosia sp. 1566]